MFRTYFCDRESGDIHEIGVYATREKAEAAAQEAYSDDIVFPDVDADVDADDDED